MLVNNNQETETQADGQRPRQGTLVPFSSSPLAELRAFQRFHVRLTALYGGAVLVVLAAMGLWVYSLWSDAELEGLRLRLLGMAVSLAETIDADAVAAIPAEQTEVTDLHRKLQDQFERISLSDPDVATIYILRPTREPTVLRFLVDYAKLGKQGEPGEVYSAADTPILLKGFSQPVVEQQPYKDEFGLSLSGYAPLRTSDGRTVGVVGLDVQVSRIEAIRQQVLSTTAVLFSVGLLLVTVASLVVARSIRQPLSRVITATSAIAQGELQTRLHLDRKDEFGLLGRHFDRMAEDLEERQFIRDTFGRYVSEDVVRALLANDGATRLGGEEVVLTILFSDLRDYTTISEGLSPTQMVQMLNRYLEVMSQVLDEHHGCVIEFMGDAILAVFGAPQWHPDHAERAVRCALAMREALDGLNREWEENGLATLWKEQGVERIEARIGMHTGPVVAGNLGSPKRMKYAVIGDTVNVAARLETLNKELNTSILISEDLRARLSPELMVRTREQGVHAVKGRQQSVRTYSL